MKRTNQDLAVGGAILVALFVLVAGVLWLKEVSVTRRMARYTVMFPNIGSLQVGDPVKVNGVKMGAVAKVDLDGTKVRVVMNIDRSVSMTDKAVVTVQNIGLMGERNIMIQLSDKGLVYAPDRYRDPDSPLLEGFFDSGIAEAMGKIGTVLDEVRVLVDNVQTVLDNTVGDTSFTVFFRTIVARLDTISRTVEVLIADNRDRIDQSLADVRAITGGLRRLLDENRGNIDEVLANANQLSAQAVRVAADAESLMVSLDGMLSSIERGEGTIGMLFEDDKFGQDLRETLAKVDTLATEVRDQGLKLRIRLGFRNRKKSN